MKSLKVMLAVLALGLGATQLEARGRVRGLLFGDDQPRQRGYEPVVRCPQGYISVQRNDGSFECFKKNNTSPSTSASRARRDAAMQR